MVVLLPACGGSGTDNGATSPALDEAADVALAPLQTDASAQSTAGIESPLSVEGLAAMTAASCAFEYNEGTLAQRSWAFDGTLVAVSTGNDTRLDGVPAATFAVNHWYTGGTGDEITVQYDLGQLSEFAPAAETGA